MKKYLHITFILILVLVFVFNSFLNASAIAIVDDSILFCIVGTVLIGCGIVGFSDVDSLSTTVKSFWSSIPDDVKSYFNGLVDLATGHGLSSFTFELTSEVIESIKNWLGGVSVVEGGSVVVGDSSLLIDGIDISCLPLNSFTPGMKADELSWFSVDSLSPLYTMSNGIKCLLQIPSLEDHSGLISSWPYSYIWCTSNYPFFGLYNSHPPTDYSMSGGSININSSDYTFDFSVGFYSGNYYLLCHKTTGFVRYFKFLNQNDVVVDGALSIPFDSTWAPGSADAEKEFTAGIPLTMPKGLVNSEGVIDSDVLVGMTTSGVRTGTADTPTETTWLESILSALDGLLDGVLEGIKSLFVPDGFSWDFFLDELGSVVSPPQAIDLKSYVQNIEIPDVTVNYKGHDLIIVDNSMLRDNITTFRKFIGSFLAILVMIYNYNMFMKLMGYGGFTVTDSGRAGNTLTPSTPVNSNLLTYPISRG